MTAHGIDTGRAKLAREMEAVTAALAEIEAPARTSRRNSCRVQGGGADDVVANEGSSQAERDRLARPRIFWSISRFDEDGIIKSWLKSWGSAFAVRARGKD